VTKFEDFAGKTPDQLADDLAKLKKEQFNLRFQRASGQLENTSRIRVVRHDIARVLTALNQRGASASVVAAAGGATAKKAKAAPKAKAKSTKAASEKPAKRASRAKKT
jgi:large subunit ribosomal protein L29